MRERERERESKNRERERARERKTKREGGRERERVSMLHCQVINYLVQIPRPLSEPVRLINLNKPQSHCSQSCSEVCWGIPSSNAVIQ